MKKLFKLLLAVMLAACAVLAVACNSEGVNPKSAPGLHVMQFKGDDFYTVYGYGAEDGVSVLDIGKIAKDSGKVIGRIKTGAFDGNASLTEIIVPDTVTEIDAGAFKGMRRLQTITLPFVGAGATADAFDGETAKTEGKITDAKRNFGYVFGSESYDYGAEISQSYGSGDAVKYYVPQSLKTVKIAPKDNYSVPMFGFNGCTNLYTVELSDKVTAIGVKAFYGCENLVKVTLSANVKNIYDSAFENCKALKEHNDTDKTGINFGGSALVKIGEKAFVGTALKAVDLTVEEIGFAAFAETDIAELTLKGVKKIGAEAFRNCKKLTAVTVTSDGVGEMFKTSFAGCEKADLSALAGFTTHN